MRGAADVELRVRESVHGPLISDVSSEFATVGANAPTDEPGERGSGYAVALAWTALEPAPPPTRSSSSTARPTGTSSAPRPPTSLGARAEPRLRRPRGPHRLPGARPGPDPPAGNDGTMPVEGWVSANDWTGEYVPFDGLPSVLDPEEGFIATANQAVIDEDYPTCSPRTGTTATYRSTRIRDALLEEGELSVSEMSALQLDTTNPMAETLVPYLLDIELPFGYYRNAQDLLRDWDFTSPADSAPAAYFNVVWRTLLERTFHDDLRQRTWPDGGDRWFLVVSRMLREPAGPWWDDVDTDEVETRDDVLRAAMVEARDELTRRQSPRRAAVGVGPAPPHGPPQRDPGRVGRRARRERLFNRDGWEVGGGSSIVDATRGTPSRATRSRRRRRCGWSSRSPTSTTRAGST